MEQKYRIREGRVEVCNGVDCWRARRFIAERRVKFLGLTFWSPVTNGDWRTTEHGAICDAERDAELRKPLKAPSYLNL